MSDPDDQLVSNITVDKTLEEEKSDKFNIANAAS